MARPDERHNVRLVAGELFHALVALLEGVVKVVNYGGAVPILQQSQDGVAACEYSNTMLNGRTIQIQCIACQQLPSQIWDTSLIEMSPRF